MNDFMLNLDELRFIGSGLHRPECVLCLQDGSIYVSDWRGGVMHLTPDGGQEAILSEDRAPGIQPNGIALLRDGSFLLANLGEAGGVWRLDRSGALRPFLTSVDGVELPPCNFVLVDQKDRTWITVSTRRRPRSLGYRSDADDGFIVLKDKKGARIVAEGLGYTNEIKFDAREENAYVVETFGRRLSRFRVARDGELVNQETVTTFGQGTFPDGLSLDAEGGIWITSIVSNRVFRVAPDGSPHLVLEDCDTHHMETVERAFLESRMDRVHLDAVESLCLRHISSLAFGGPDLRTVYLGCLLDDRLATFRSPLPGLPPVHWTWG